MESFSDLAVDKPYKKMALVIEDDPAILEILEFSLKEAGYYPLLFTNAEDVLVILRSLVMEIIILDLMLPGINGVEFVHELERRKRRNAPILVLSAMQLGRRKAQEINAEGYLQKPFGIKAFIDLVNKLVEEHAELRRIETLL